jgi:glutamate dehydrogenase
VVNFLVNGAGITFFHRLSEETGASAEELVRANFVAREIFGSRRFVDAIYRLDNHISSPTQIEMRIVMRTLVERATRWLINNRRAPMDSAATVRFFQDTAEKLLDAMPDLLSGRELGAFERRRSRFVDGGVPEDLATRVSVLPPAYAILTIVETARRDDVDPLEVCRLHFALGDRLGLSSLVDRILALPREDRWQTMARAALRDDLHSVHSALTAEVLGCTSEDQPVDDRISDWEKRNEIVVGRARATLNEICSDDNADLARMSVGLRVVRTLLASA